MPLFYPAPRISVAFVSEGIRGIHASEKSNIVAGLQAGAFLSTRNENGPGLKPYRIGPGFRGINAPAPSV
jgi:hypothetical protein